MLANVIVIGVIVVSLLAAIGSFVHGQREIGRAEIKAAQAEKDRKLAARDAEMDRKAKEASDEIARRQKARAVDSERKLATMQAIARSLSDGIAAKDPIYADWRSTRIPDGAPIRLRDDGNVSTSKSRGVPVSIQDGTHAKPSR